MSTALALARYLLRLHQSCSWLQLSAAAVRRFMCTGAALRLEEPLPYFPVLPLRGAITRHQFYLRLRSVFNPAAVLNLGVCKRQNRKKRSCNVNVTCCAKAIYPPCVICLFFVGHCLHFAQCLNGAVCRWTVQDPRPPPRQQPITTQHTGVSDEPCDADPLHQSGWPSASLS